ncbi:MAG: ferrochelatase [Acidimicrobiia bacterium]|nr:ferrochelatase [Acidimicrobiia bacterium]MXZ78734.1 ferrochelatase [Acidimicrobiia bacterium]MXZ85643.1 ferrochelatase [Acidimicrobiia bacterium]MYB74497.1 ferrochelatase [Acidimicrobiia bacterium]MYE72916.1 ferrochelatase [Acidimicrobiia bacterium]
MPTIPSTDPALLPAGQEPEAILIVSFGGPEGPDDVMPFLRNVTRGRGIGDERLAAVAEHYHLFGGVSPINQCNRDLVAALAAELGARGVDLPVYWGNRNWSPMLADTMAQMRDDGVSSAVGFATSAFGSYSGCRQYAEDIERARAEVGPDAPLVYKVPPFWDQDGFLSAMADNLGVARRAVPTAPVVFTAHSIPESMAATAPYEAQLNEACHQVAERAVASQWSLAYQSRSGSPQIPWLEPDIGDQLDRLADAGADAVVVVPIGFVADHMEVIYDLDTEARQRADMLGLRLIRVPTVGTHPAFVKMIADLVLAPLPAPCPVDCCLR